MAKIFHSFFKSKSRIGCLTALLLLLCSGLLQAEKDEPSDISTRQIIELIPEKQLYNIAPLTKYFEDATGKLKLRDILKPENQERFLPEEKDIANFGFTSSAYWFKIRLKSLSDISRLWILGIEYSLLDYIDVFYTADGKFQRIAGGDRRSFLEREIRNRFPYFKMRFNPGEQKTVYIRVRTLGSAEIPIRIMTPLYYASIDHEMQFGQGIFVGIMSGLAIFYFLISIGSRNREYVLYACFVTALVLFKSTMNGFTMEYLWGYSIWLTNAAAAFTTPAVFFFELLYAFYFLDIKERKWSRYIYYAFIGVFAFTTLFGAFLPYKLLKIYTVLGFLANILIMVTALKAYRPGLKSASYFLYSCGFLIVGVFLYSLQKLGVLPSHFVITYCIEITGVIQAIGFAIAQTDKINLINKKIRKVQKQALEAQIETNRITEVMKNKLEELVNERTRDLWQKTQDIKVMMDSIKQGIAVVDGKLTISGEYSAFLETIVGKRQLAGYSLMSSVIEQTDMNKDSQNQVVAAVDMMIGEDSLNFEANEHTLPKKLKVRVAERRMDLELDWAPIEDQDGNVKELLVSIRDVTELMAIRADAEKKEHELTIIGQILRHTSTKFNRFITSAKHLVASCEAFLLEENAQENWEKILRDVHTIKGNARTYGFTEIAAEVHTFEDLLFSVDKDNLSEEVLNTVRTDLNKVLEHILEYQRISDEVLGRTDSLIMEATLQDVGVFLSDFIDSELFALYKDRDMVSQLDLKVRDLVCESFRGTISPLQGSLESLATQLGKKVPKISISGHDFNIDSELSEKFEDIFVHLIRNSIDHGFDYEQQGEIEIVVEEAEEQRKIVYRDSGRGLNLVKLDQIAHEKLGIEGELSEENNADLIFRSQVSSAEKVSDISGRGVGMSAVKGFVEELGGVISIQLLDHKKEGYRAFEIVMILPKLIDNLTKSA